MHKEKKTTKPNSRDIRKAKTKWESKPNDRELMNNYINILCQSWKFKEVELTLLSELKKRKKQKRFLRFVFSITNKWFNEIDKNATSELIDAYLIVFDNSEVRSEVHGNKLSPKFLTFIKRKLKKSGRSLDEEVPNENEAKPKKITVKEEIIKKSSIKRKSIVFEVYSLFKDNSEKKSFKDKEIEKAIFKIAKNIKKWDENNAQELLDFCIKLSPKNDKYKKLNEKWNPVIEDIATTIVLEGPKAEVEVEEESDESPIAIKRVYTFEDFYHNAPRIKKILSEKEIQEIVESNKTKFGRDRRWAAALISLGNVLLNNLERTADAFIVYEIIKTIESDGDLRVREVKQANRLMHSIYIAWEKYDDAKIWNDIHNLGIEIDISDNIQRKVKKIVVKDNSEAEREFYELVKAQGIKHYRERVDYYINDGQFKYQLGEEVSETVMNNLKDKIATDLKYLDFEIREIMMPYYIKIESHTRLVLGIMDRRAIGHAIDKSLNSYSREMRLILDVTKINENDFEEKKLFQEFILAYRMIRNFMAHGAMNIFRLKKFGWKQNDVKDTNFDNDNWIFESGGSVMYDEILERAEKQTGEIDIFKLETSMKVLSDDAIKNNRIFGISLIILFMALPKYTFARIASEIDHKINTFKNRTVFGSKSKLYESLGLKEDWLINLLDSAEKE